MQEDRLSTAMTRWDPVLKLATRGRFADVRHALGRLDTTAQPQPGNGACSGYGSAMSRYCRCLFHLDVLRTEPTRLLKICFC